MPTKKLTDLDGSGSSSVPIGALMPFHSDESLIETNDQHFWLRTGRVTDDIATYPAMTPERQGLFEVARKAYPTHYTSLINHAEMNKIWMMKYNGHMYEFNADGTQTGVEVTPTNISGNNYYAGVWNGTHYVLVSQLGTVNLYDANWAFVSTFGDVSSATAIKSVAFDGTYYYLANGSADQIDKYDATFTLVEQNMLNVKAASNIISLTYSSADNTLIFITTSVHRLPSGAPVYVIKKINLAGEIIEDVSDEISELIGEKYAASFTFDSEGTLYVSSTASTISTLKDPLLVGDAHAKTRYGLPLYMRIK